MPLRLRLTIAFALLLAVVLAQLAGIVHLVARAEAQREASLLARDMLQGMTNFSANKQRLKVGYAEALLTGRDDPARRDALLGAMARDIALLGALAQRQAALAGGGDGAKPDARDIVGRLERNFAAFRGRVATAPRPDIADAPRAWQEMLAVFDVSEGRDMRVETDGAIRAQAAAAAADEVAAAGALAQVRLVMLASVGATLLLCLVFVAYFVWAIRRPTEALVQGTQALAEGDLGHRIGLPARDEFGRIAAGFDRMAAQLQGHREALERAVAERTAELRAANARLEAIDAARRRFFADVGHELRTPTTALIGEAEVALRGPKDKPAAEYRAALERVASTARVMADRVRDLLRLARAEEPGVEAHLETLDLRELLVQVIEQHEAAAAAAGVRLLPHGEVGTCAVPGDAMRLAQLLGVLIDNAIAYTPPGGRVGARIEPLASPPRWRLVVHDEGIGLSDIDAEHAFERLARGARARALRPDGAGLGLAIARAIARAHGARLWLQARAGGGAEAVLELPAAAPSGTAGTAVGKPAEAVGEAAGAG
jgi:signal transduction histidine kinase